MFQKNNRKDARAQSFLRFHISFFFSIFLTANCFSQESSKGEVYQYARKIVDTLASPSMHGRGYVKNGDRIAAKYIAEEFKKYGLLSCKKLQTGDPKTLYKNYFQYFELSINTFPGRMTINASNGVRYEDGLDVPMIGFRPDPSSPSIKGKFKIVNVNDTVIRNKAVGNFTAPFLIYQTRPHR